ncbi:MBL fold metallo-hydrolase [Inquilinus sp. CAU 1745]|uniref:MBL fold metallo-hydrolase n=1 Tax=Inquilinus sp. CAU 1745 TaxID=3140369 RepID=UPI00325C2423
MNIQAASPEMEALDPITTNLFASAPQELSFAPDEVVRSFLICSDDGNLLLNASEGALRSASAIDRLGGAGALWLGHWHEGITGAQAIADRLGTPVIIHEADREEAEKKVAIAQTFDDARQIRPDLRAIPIPGHTPGSTAYLWHGPDARCLFTADSLLVKDGELRGVLLESSDRRAFLESLSRLRDIEFELLIPWPALKGAVVATPYTPEAFRRDLDAVVSRIEAGGDG